MSYAAGGIMTVSGGDLYPLGDAHNGHAFLAIDRVGRVYLVGDAIALMGDNVRAALDAIFIGRLAKKITG